MGGEREDGDSRADAVADPNGPPRASRPLPSTQPQLQAPPETSVDVSGDRGLTVDRWSRRAAATWLADRRARARTPDRGTPPQSRDTEPYGWATAHEAPSQTGHDGSNPTPAAVPGVVEDGDVGDALPPAIARRRRVLRVLFACAGVCALLVALMPLMALATIYWFGRGAGDIDLGPLARYDPPKTIRVVTDDGTLLGEIGGPEHRRVVALDDFPEHVVDAFLAAEDADFFKHGPTDPRAIVRATLANLTAGELRQGASTLTQQTVKNVLLTHERTVERKSKEILLAARVEHELGKRHVLAVYLNEIYLGEGRYGVPAAARHYFGKDLDALDLGEAATLASLPKAPSAMSPYRDPARLRARRDWVLERMVAEGMATREAVAPFLGEPLAVLPEDAPRSDTAAAPEVLDAVHEQLLDALDAEAVARLGGEVRVTLDLDLQAQARAAAVAQLDALEAKHGYGAHARPLDDTGRERVRARMTSAPEAGALVTGLVHSNTDDAGLWIEFGDDELLVPVEGWSSLDGAARRDRFPAGGRIEVQLTRTTPSSHGLGRAALAPGPEVAVVVADVSTGAVRALVGGRAPTRGGFDRARHARRQPGSAFKPFVYAAAIAARSHTAASSRPGEGDVLLTMRDALARSDNAVALTVLGELVEGDDYGAVTGLAGRVGLRSPLRPHPSLALGTSEVTPWELTRGYATFARGGVDRPLHLVSRVLPDPVLTPDGAERPPLPARLEAPALRGEPHRALDAPVAFIVSSMLRSVIEFGTARAAGRALDFPAAGKTGTTDEARDGWFAGYSSRHVATVWVGFDQPRSLGPHEHGSSTALPVWIDVMRAAEARPPRGPTPSAGVAGPFSAPPEVARALIDTASGRAACRIDEHWWREGYCTGGFFFRSCEPAGHADHPPYHRCTDPGAWRGEWFLPATSPAPHRPRRLDDAGVRVREVAIFDPSVIAAAGAAPSPVENAPPDESPKLAAVREAVERLRVRVEQLVAPELPRLVPYNARTGGPTVVSVRVRLDAGGFVRSTAVLDARHGDGPVGAVLRAAVARAIVGSELPAALIDPHSGEAEVVLEIGLHMPATHD